MANKKQIKLHGEPIEIDSTVWSSNFGYGVVKSVSFSREYPILVKFENVTCSFSESGKRVSEEVLSSLFRSEIKASAIEAAKIKKNPEFSYWWYSPSLDKHSDGRYTDRQMEEMIKSSETKDWIKIKESTKEERTSIGRRVVCAAIRAEDGSIMVGVRHYSADMHAQILSRSDGEKFAHRSDDDQGFVDQFGDYLTREEAWIVANDAGQIVRDVGRHGKLFSENLY